MLDGANIVVLDLETLYSADDCRHCGAPEAHHAQEVCGDSHSYMPLGWRNPPALGLSIGCWWDYLDGRLHWFDRQTLGSTVALFVNWQPLLVSFNGMQFDFVLLEGWRRGDAPPSFGLCEDFADLASRSYDLLAAIWQADPVRKFERGLNSLGVISEANGYGAKEMDGATAPRLWAQGRYAEVIAYNVSDVLKTKALFEQVFVTGLLIRGDGNCLAIPRPSLPC